MKTLPKNLTTKDLKKALKSIHNSCKTNGCVYTERRKNGYRVKYWLQSEINKQSYLKHNISNEQIKIKMSLGWNDCIVKSVIIFIPYK